MLIRVKVVRIIQFLSTPSARRATGATGIVDPKDNISIHALCEEGDARAIRKSSSFFRFLSTPSARRATRIKIWVVVSTPKLFLSTPSARRATTAGRCNGLA